MQARHGSGSSMAPGPRPAGRGGAGATCRALFCAALGAACLVPAARAHGPSDGGPDDPEASARRLAFDARLEGASRPPDERPLPWVLPRPAPAPAPARPSPVRPAPPAAAAQGMAYHGSHAHHAAPVPPAAP